MGFPSIDFGQTDLGMPEKFNFVTLLLEKLWGTKGLKVRCEVIGINTVD
jgi:hypothetical protein